MCTSYRLFLLQRQARGEGSANKTDPATDSSSGVIEKPPDEPTSTSSAAAKGSSAMDDLLGLQGSFTSAHSEQTNPWGAAAPFGNNPFQPVNPATNSTSDPWGPQPVSGNTVW